MGRSRETGRSRGTLRYFEFLPCMKPISAAGNFSCGLMYCACLLFYSGAIAVIAFSGKFVKDAHFGGFGGGLFDKRQPGAETEVCGIPKVRLSYWDCFSVMK